MALKSILSLFAAGVFLSNTVGAQSLSTGLVAYYSFDGNFNDSSQYANHATPHGGVTFATDKWGNANSCASFDGIDDWVDAPATVYNTLGKRMTLSFLYKPFSPVAQEIISKSDYNYPPTHNFQYQVGFNQQSVINITGSNDHLFFSTNHTGNCNAAAGLANDYLFTDSFANLAQWSCITVVFDSGVKSMYVDDQLIGTKVVTAGNSASLDSCIGGTLRFGIWWAQHQMYYEGLLDEVRIYNRVLDREEIHDLCSGNIINGIETVNKEAFNIYNDFSAGKVYITKTATIGDCSLKIFNQLGQVVYTSRFDQNKMDISTSNFASGIYIIQLKTPTGISNQKLILQ